MTNDRSSSPSRLAQAVFVAYGIALVWGSLFPLAGWRDAGVPPFGFLFDPWPRWWTWFDVAFNVAIYLPGGMIIAMLLRQSRWRRLAVALALLGCSLAAIGLESLQSYLPNRVPSRLDWLANSAGGLVGALFAPWGERLASAGQRALSARIAIDGTDSATAITLLIAWLAIQWPPQRLLFGSGDLQPVFQTVHRWLGGLPATAAGWRLDASHGVFAEALGVSMALVGVGLLVREVLPTRAPRAAITGLLIFAAVSIKTVASATVLGPARAVNWLTAGAQGGLLIGAVILALLASARRATRLQLAIGALAITALVATLFPLDTYFSTELAASEIGNWRNLDGLLRGAATLWPYAAMIWCGLRVRALHGLPLRPTRPL